MNTDEAMRALWMTISGYAEDCLSDDSEELEELQQAWTIVSEKMRASVRETYCNPEIDQYEQTVLLDVLKMLDKLQQIEGKK